MTAYYNENDPNAAAWLRELIREGHIAPGDVDERSILDVKPDDLRAYTQCHFFAGVGVWSYALRCAGWPDGRPVWTGSCPCQPFSAAGKRGGIADERHLWPAWQWLVGQCRPGVVLGEQVASKDGLAWLDLVRTDMEGTDYAVGFFDLCAAGFGAPHIRQRLYFSARSMAEPAGERWERRRSGETRAEPGTVERPERLCASGRMADDDRTGCGEDAGRSVYDTEHHAQSRRGASGLGDACGESSERRTGSLFGTKAPVDSARLVDGRGADRPEHAGAGLSNWDATGPVNGFWRDADWLFCRDGKWRPVEPKPQQMVDGSTRSLGPVLPGDIEALEFDVAEWSIRHQADAGKTLHDLRSSFSARAKREWPVGGLPDISSAPILLAFLRQLQEQGWDFAECISKESAETAETRMRVLRNEGKAARASRRRELDEQFAGERADALRVLSSILARHAQAAWGDAHAIYAATGNPLVQGARSRVARLRGYGNAIVAPQAQGFVEAYLTAERDGFIRLGEDIFG